MYLIVVKLNEREGVILIVGASCNLKRHLTPLKKKRWLEIINSLDDICFLVNLPSSHLVVLCKTAVQTVYAKFTEKHLCWGTFLLFLQTEDNIVKKGVRRKGFLVTLQNFSERLNNKQLRAPTSGITAILAIGLKALQTNFFVLCSLCQYDCRTKITKSPKKERARLLPKALQ